MSNEMVSVPREAFKWAIEQLEEDGNKGCGYFDSLRALLAAPACAHTWTDDGMFTLLCTKCGETEQDLNSPEDEPAVPPAGGEPDRLDVEMLKGGTWRLASDPDGLMVRYDDHRAHVTRLLAENKRLDLMVAQGDYNRDATVMALRAELDALKAAQPQGEPVAKLHAERLSGKDGEYGITVENSEWFNTCRLIGGVFNLYTSPPAPVAVVLPALKTAEEYYTRLGNCNSARLAADEFNSALDEVARLNSL
ncbi:hypothetical protein C4K14_2130 [Pseudomonas chlororaphis subsp. aureofaciens]|uniref:hypothetical protein n=1 Tax=Pseudomonas chlororaphis TaxID=587753 RepID=UPI000F580220|nr:hypothetical protein [Pseudomonas chlororaphis]AZD84964.1 hypothetical protein C4K14_2130 [Pseudomonas chlororaphis subsp. aureofaciens]